MKILTEKRIQVVSKIIFVFLFVAFLAVAADVLFLGSITEEIWWSSYAIPTMTKRVNVAAVFVWLALLVLYGFVLKKTSFKAVGKNVVIVAFMVLVMTHNFTTEKFVNTSSENELIYDAYSESLIIEKMVSGAMHGEDKKGMMFYHDSIFGDIWQIYNRGGEGITNANFSEGYAVGVPGGICIA